MTTSNAPTFSTFCCACDQPADPRYFTAGEHLCAAHWTEFYGKKA